MFYLRQTVQPNLSLRYYYNDGSIKINSVTHYSYHVYYNVHSTFNPLKIFILSQTNVLPQTKHIKNIIALNMVK